jgi:hypothetical protein
MSPTNLVNHGVGAHSKFVYLVISYDVTRSIANHIVKMLLALIDRHLFSTKDGIIAGYKLHRNII